MQLKSLGNEGNFYTQNKCNLDQYTYGDVILSTITVGQRIARRMELNMTKKKISDNDIFASRYRFSSIQGARRLWDILRYFLHVWLAMLGYFTALDIDCSYLLFTFFHAHLSCFSALYIVMFHAWHLLHLGVYYASHACTLVVFSHNILYLVGIN